MSKYGIPYMGSKGTVAESLSMIFPKAENFYDLFGGGFSMTHCMMKNKSHRFSKFHYNEIRTDVVKLVEDCLAGKFNENIFTPSWITREEFHEKKETDAYIGLCWSFGNNKKGYLFGEDIEEYKRSMHMAVVFNEFDELATKVFSFNSWPVWIDSIYKKRLFLRKKIEFYRTTSIPEFLHRFIKGEQLEQLQRLKQLQRLQQLQKLQHLERLDQLQKLEKTRTENLFITSKDYREIEIKNSSVVYCDIPYAGTADYGDFSHEEFFNWAASRAFPVYVSEYNIEDPRFKLVYSLDKRSKLAPKNIDNQQLVKQEKLYWNGVKNG